MDHLPAPRDPVAVYSDGAEQELLRLMAQLGPTFRIFEPNARKWMVVSGDPVVAEHVLVKNARGYKKGFFIGVVELLLGGGLMSSEGPEWLEQRRKMQRMFQGRALPFLREHNQEALALWRQQDVLDMSLLTSRLVLRSTLKALFGEARPEFDLLADISARDMRFRESFRSLDPLVAGLVRERMATPKDDAVSALVQGDANVDQWVKEVKTLIVAGHETTASAMAWMWYLLAQDPQPDVANEHIINETLRLYPPGWLLSRKALAADPALGIEQHTEVLISPYLLGRNPAYWDEAQAFRPARFAQPIANKFAFIPFSAGPRRCPGDDWALQELHAHLEVMRPVLHLQLEAPVETEARVNLRSRQPILFRIRR